MSSDQGPLGENYPGNYPGGYPGASSRKKPGFFTLRRGSLLTQEQETSHLDSMDTRTPWRRSVRILAVVVSFGFFGFITWFSYQQGHQDGSDSTPPLIKVDVNPSMVRHDKPGGMKIPDQDKLVYNRVDPSAQAPTVERLLMPPEIPLPRGQSDTASSSQKVPEPLFPKTGQFFDIPVPVIPEQLPPQFESDQEPSPIPQAQGPQNPVPAVPPAPVQVAAPKATAVPPAVSPAGGYLVQLGAFRSEDTARVGWTRIQGQQKDLLAAMTSSFQRADIGSKGVFFRLRAGPLASESAAKNICAELAKRKVSCLVIRP
jgi:cell division septation protein DedD